MCLPCQVHLENRNTHNKQAAAELLYIRPSRPRWTPPSLLIQAYLIPSALYSLNKHLWSSYYAPDTGSKDKWKHTSQNSLGYAAITNDPKNSVALNNNLFLVYSAWASCQLPSRTQVHRTTLNICRSSWQRAKEKNVADHVLAFKTSDSEWHVSFNWPKQVPRPSLTLTE